MQVKKQQLEQVLEQQTGSKQEKEYAKAVYCHPAYLTLILWPPHVKSWLIGKDFDAGRDWLQEEGMTEDEMAGWHRRLDGHEFE